MLDDTAPAIRRKMDEYYRSLEPWQRFAIVRELNRRVDEIALVGFRERHPEDDDQQLRLRLAALKHGPELVSKAFGVPVESLGY